MGRHAVLRVQASAGMGSSVASWSGRSLVRAQPNNSRAPSDQRCSGANWSPNVAQTVAIQGCSASVCRRRARAGSGGTLPWRCAASIAPSSQRQWLGLGVRERTLRQGHSAHGRAGEPAQHLPQQHPGLADLVRGPRVRARLFGAARRRGHDGGHEPANLGHRRGRNIARRLPVLRQHPAYSRIQVPHGHQRHRRAADRNQQQGLHRAAPAPIVQEHHLRGRPLGAA